VAGAGRPGQAQGLAHHRLRPSITRRGPVLPGARIADAFARTVDLAARPYLPTPDQSLLDQLLSAFDPAAPTGAAA
jgi:hypothetical protein